MIVLELCGELLGRGSGSAVHQHDQGAAPHALVVRVLHGVEHERGPRLRPQRFGIRRGQESGGEESTAQPEARRVFAFPERRRITGCLGLFLALVDQLDEVSQKLSVLPVCLACRSLQLPLERGEVLRPQSPPDEVIRHRFQADGGHHSRCRTGPLRTPAISRDIDDQSPGAGMLHGLDGCLELRGHQALGAQLYCLVTGAVTVLRAIDVQGVDRRLTKARKAARHEQRDLDDADDPAFARQDSGRENVVSREFDRRIAGYQRGQWRSLHARCVAQSLAAEPTGDRLAAGGGRRRPTDSHVPVTEAACQSFKGDSGVPLTVCPDDAIARGYEGGTDVVIAPEYLPLQARVLRRKCGSRFLKIVQVWLGIEACGRSLTDLRTRRAYLASGAAWRREEYAEEGHAEWGPIHRPSPTLEIPEFALHERERRDRRRLGAQDPRTEAHGNEARLHGRLLLVVSESALGPDEHGDRRDRSRYVLDACRPGGREQQARAACTLPEELSERNWRQHLRQAVAAALLAGGDGDGAPVLELARCLRCAETHDAALGEERHDAGSPELGRLLHDEIHALAA